MVGLKTARIINKRYTLHEIIGQGGMGTVYRATDRLSQQTVALKVVNTALSGDTDAEQRLVLAQEFKTLASLRHPNIISVLDYGFHDDQPYYAMDWLEKAQNILEAGAKQPFQRQAALLNQLLQALTYLHRRGIIHRDLKPNNVLVVGGVVKVLDFGLALPREERNEKSSRELVGTLAYMAPELLEGQAASEASDMYALGVIAYMLAAGEHPFNTDDISGLLDAVLLTPPKVDALDIPPEFRAIIGRMMAKKPYDRFQDAEQLIEQYTAVTGQPKPDESARIRESFLQAARFVGREREFERLTDALKVTLKGHGSAWLIGGESGVGKSRLIEELRTAALVEGALVLRGQAIAEGGAPYQLWRDLLRYICLEVELTPFEASVIKPLVGDISTLLGYDVPDPPAIDLTALQNRLINVIEGLMSRLERPVLILLEDLQWAHESLAILRRLSPLTASLSLMIVATYRTDEGRDLAQELPQMQRLELLRLKPSAIAELSASMLGESIARQPQVLDLIERETEGNVFFIVEVVRALAESAGRLSQIGHSTLPQQIFAQGLKTILQQRLGRVPANAQGLLRAAAVAGRELDLAVLEQLIQQDPTLSHSPLETWLSLCADAAVIDVNEGRWRFSHDKLREALLGELSPELSRGLHAQVATAIEAVYPDDSNRWALLAHLWEVADEPAKIAQATAAAGKQALETASYQEAVGFLLRARGLAAQLGQKAEERAALEHGLGEAYFALGRLDEGLSHARGALALLNKQNMPPATWTHLPYFIWQAGRFLIQQSLRLSPSQNPAADLMAARSCEHLMEIYYFKNTKLLMGFYALQGLNIAERVGERGQAEQGRVYASFGMFLSVLPIHPLARHFNRKADQASQHIQDLNALSWINLMRAVMHTCFCEWEIAREILEDCIHQAKQSGHIRRWEEGKLALAAVQYFSGEWDDSAELADELYESAQSQGNLQGIAWGLDDQGRVAMRRGKHQEALSRFEKSIQIYNDIQDMTGKIWVEGALATLHLRLGNPEAAKPYAEQTKAILSSTPPGAYGLLEGYHGMIEFYMQQYEKDPSPQNQALAAECLRLFRQYARIFYLGRALLAVYTSWFHFIKGDAATGQKQAEQALELAERFHMPYEAGLACYHTGRFMLRDAAEDKAAEGQKKLRQALHIFAQLGAEWDMMQAQATLEGR